jgi:hypothetical protein
MTEAMFVYFVVTMAVWNPNMNLSIVGQILLWFVVLALPVTVFISISSVYYAICPEKGYDMHFKILATTITMGNIACVLLLLQNL